MSHLDLAPIGNCGVASLVDPNGRHVWFCFPRLDGMPAFDALVNGDNPERGFMDVVVEKFAGSGQRYLPNTAVLETVLSNTEGEQLRILDFAPRYRQFGRSFRPPMLVRRIEPLKGQPRVTLRLRPSFDYGATRPDVTIGSNHLRYVGAKETLRITADVGPAYYHDETPFVLSHPVNLFIGSDESVLDEPDGLAKRFLHETVAYWTDWCRQLAIPFDWQEEVIRAAITLKLCTCEETGAVLAALTTSIPESPNSGRNWDYRYCWLRDSYFTVNAMNRLGVTRTMENYVRFLVDAVVRDGASMLHPLYPINSRSDLTERVAPALAGYRGMGPVRIGNAAAEQRQNDVYGSVILSAAQIFCDARIPSIGGEHLYRRLKPMGELAYAYALKPDAGLWEYRNRAAVFTYSAAMGWAGTQRTAMIARIVGDEETAVRMERQAAALKEEILRRAETHDGWISGMLDGEIADASVLLLPQFGLLPATDERFLRTIKLVEERLVRNGFVMRYDEADDFGTPETAFLVCTFWYIDALALSGRQTEARELFERVLSKRNRAGLLSEDICPQTGELWGNFPQTYSLVGLALSAHHLSRSWEEGLWRPA
jgi:hypothetical protein